MVEIEYDIGPSVSFHPQDMEASMVPAAALVTVAAARRRRQTDPRRGKSRLTGAAVLRLPRSDSGDYMTNETVTDLSVGATPCTSSAESG
jgi:hypothetical protein